ncbi:MAG: tRNA(His) guanylyltransferase Thg1 family protein [Methanobacteriaceae archaeon]|nr:tRNA(His) guanylyltransferase Thg1 family protein [Methanobacteriaceae archaeon]
MKDYEIYSNLNVPKGSNVVLRLDGRKFHTLSRKLNLEKPYDINFSSLMVEVSKDLFREFSPKFIYTFSDEISILLDEIPFGGRIEKLDSVFASIASGSFTYHFMNDLDKFDINFEDDLKSIILPISFDSRVVPVGDDVLDYFKWRQDESWRNCVNAYGIWALNQDYSSKVATEKIRGLKSKDIHELLFERGINLNNVETWKKRGIGIYKKSHKIEGFNPLKNEKTISSRSELFVDLDLELFNQDFFDKF